MNWLIGALIIVLGITLIISGQTGTAGQVYAIVTGRGADTPNGGGDLGAGVLAPPHGATTVPGGAFHMGTP